MDLPPFTHAPGGSVPLSKKTNFKLQPVLTFTIAPTSMRPKLSQIVTTMRIPPFASAVNLCYNAWDTTYRAGVGLDRIPAATDVSIFTPIWVYGVSLLGAIVGFLEEFKKEDGALTWLLKIVTRIGTSLLAGIITYHAILAMGIPSGWYIPIVAISGHMGVEALRAFGALWKAKMGVPQ